MYRLPNHYWRFSSLQTLYSAAVASHVPQTGVPSKRIARIVNRFGLQSRGSQCFSRVHRDSQACKAWAPSKEGEGEADDQRLLESSDPRIGKGLFPHLIHHYSHRSHLARLRCNPRRVLLRAAAASWVVVASVPARYTGITRVGDRLGYLNATRTRWWSPPAPTPPSIHGCPIVDASHHRMFFG